MLTPCPSFSVLPMSAPIRQLVDGYLQSTIDPPAPPFCGRVPASELILTRVSCWQTPLPPPTASSGTLVPVPLAAFRISRMVLRSLPKIKIQSCLFEHLQIKHFTHLPPPSHP